MLVLGALLVGGALLSGVAQALVPVARGVFVLVGFVLGEGGLEVLELEPRRASSRCWRSIALIVILFRDGLEVDAEMLQTEWHLPLRKLVLAMPITVVIVALAAQC